MDNFRCYELPFTNGAFGVELYEDDTERPTTGHGLLRLTKSAIAGISAAEIDYFDPGIIIAFNVMKNLR